MQLQKLRTNADGLIPAGVYFADIAAKLEEMNARDAAPQDDLKEEDHTLEATYRKRSAGDVYGERAKHAVM